MRPGKQSAGLGGIQTGAYSSVLNEAKDSTNTDSFLGSPSYSRQPRINWLSASPSKYRAKKLAEHQQSAIGAAFVVAIGKQVAA